MANLRESPYIWVTWLAKIMAGDITCQWQSWFRSQNKEIEKQPDDFDLVGWKMDHTKMLTELKEKLIKENYSPIIEQSVKYKIPNLDITVAAKPDCIIEKKDVVIIYDCKTGKERSSDQVQVMIYMYLLSKGKFSGKQSKGVVIYKDKKIEIPNLPENFEDNFNFFVNVLSSPKPPTKNPGADCKFCSITKNDCSERVD
ncbi:MAG: PD-(D/E)XK nuclease family protein [Nanoarchaeota archaeon]|nr:PD-(D/E)XK nuclease family protein [Nanoarchaeota archaeon]